MIMIMIAYIIFFVFVFPARHPAGVVGEPTSSSSSIIRRPTCIIIIIIIIIIAIIIIIIIRPPTPQRRLGERPPPSPETPRSDLSCNTLFSCRALVWFVMRKVIAIIIIFIHLRQFSASTNLAKSSKLLHIVNHPLSIIGIIFLDLIIIVMIFMIIILFANIRANCDES